LNIFATTAVSVTDCPVASKLGARLGTLEGELLGARLVVGFCEAVGDSDGLEGASEAVTEGEMLPLGVSEGRALGIPDGSAEALGFSEGDTEGTELDVGLKEGDRLVVGTVEGVKLTVTEGGLLRLGAEDPEGPADGKELVLGIAEGDKEGVSESSCDGARLGASLGIDDGSSEGTEDDSPDGTMLEDGANEGISLETAEGALLRLGAKDPVGVVDGPALDEGAVDGSKEGELDSPSATSAGPWLGTSLGTEDGSPEGFILEDGTPEGLSLTVTDGTLLRLGGEDPVGPADGAALVEGVELGISEGDKEGPLDTTSDTSDEGP
jgi:hypothetical protein